MDEWINAVDPSLRAAVGGLQTQLIEKAKILLLASHSQRVLEEWVDRLIWLDYGEIRADGEIKSVYREYRKWFQTRSAPKAVDQSARI
jgi:ABC-2 type transport system ATP-binding protein/lipopolysaccharide transport system ATP-binding protein